MTETHIDGALLSRMFITGAALLEKCKIFTERVTMLCYVHNAYLVI